MTRILLVLALITALHAGDAPASGKTYKLLVLTQSVGFVHDPVKRKNAPFCLVETTVTEIGKVSGLFETECTQNAADITVEKLKTTDAMLFYTTGKLPIPAETWAAVVAWLKSGKALIGVHSATDTAGPPGSPTYAELINGQFAGHPWGQGTPETFTVHDPAHPTVKMWGGSFDYKEEIYQYKGYDPKAVRVLISLDFFKTAKKAAYHVPVCWVRELDQGRMFYTNLGHTPSTWNDAKFKDHLLQGLRWALKLEAGPATPNPELQDAEQIKAFLASNAAATGKSLDELATLTAKLASADPAWLDATATSIPCPSRAAKGAAPDAKKLAEDIAAKVK